MTEIKKIMIVAGEVSGDAHAAKLVRALRSSAPEINFEFFGATGQQLRGENVETVVNADELSIVGLLEIGKALPTFWRAFRKLKKSAVEKKPDAVILIDFPDFNLKLAKSLGKRGLKIIYYISPQLWAWRKYRVSTIKKHVDLMLAILPFEKNWYAEQGISHVEYVGNPTVREVHANLSKDEFCRQHNLKKDQPIVALLGGSRHKEIVKILPVMLETAALMEKRNPEIQFVIALAATRKTAEVEAAKSGAKDCPKNLIIVQNQTYDALNAADAAIVTSGTATLETGIIGTPLAIVYKTSNLNYKLLRPLINVAHFGLINLIAGKRVANEFIQDDFTPEILAKEMFRLLEPAENKKVRAEFGQIAEELGRGGASANAARAVLKFLGGHTDLT